MDENSRRSLGLEKWAAILVVLVLVVYPLSVGPAALLQATAKSSRVNDVLATIYHPLNLLPESIVAPIDAWGRLWIRLAPG